MTTQRFFFICFRRGSSVFKRPVFTFPTWISPLRRRVLTLFPSILLVALCAVCLVAPAEAQHGGGGGGRFGGGHSWHSSSAHSSGNHTRGHFSWLRFGLGRRQQVEAPAAQSAAPLWNFSAHTALIRSMPTTMLWSPLVLRPGRDGRISFTTPRLRSQRNFLYRRFTSFRNSGCFFNGISQVCYFEPFLPLPCFGFDFDYRYFGGAWPDADDDWAGLGQPDMSGIAPAGNSSYVDSTEKTANSAPPAAAAASPEDWDLGPRVFVLVLGDGISRPVIDYWAVDGYLEYILPDGTRSHIPLAALDLESTVKRNAPRGLKFVLRTTPAETQ
jgi:hypothetical protein